MKLLKKPRFMFLFLIPFLLSSSYVLLVQTELYESSSTILIKDLTPTASSSNLLSALMPTSSSNLQESMLLQKYLYSMEMFIAIDKKFALKKHYKSSELDFLQRLYSFSSTEDLLSLYKKHLIVMYDELSNTLEIDFLHTDPKIAQKILNYIVAEAEEKLNMYEKENGSELLKFIEEQENQNKRLLVTSIEKLMAYQNSHATIDPSVDIQAKSSILAQLEGTLVQKEMEYAKLKQYMSDESIELKTIRGEIKSLKGKLRDVRSKLAGSEKNELNSNLFAFETLKAEVELNKERYKQTLIQKDMAMIQSTQNAKNLIIITQPTLSDEYLQPNKLKSFITLLLVLLMVYGIVSMIQAIIKDHRD
jgi:capsular polysaccharide transport system permease protein